ncbi:MAG: DUF433 domain-containing protein [Bacteroidales bacterium]|nr:DUF433 domain-containing protein [Bacteroidales bacterium]
MKNKVINIDPEIMGGTPVFNGTRVPVQTLFDYLEGGNTVEKFLEDFPSVNKEQIVKILEFAKKTVINENVIDENLT